MRVRLTPKKEITVARGEFVGEVVFSAPEFRVRGIQGRPTTSHTTMEAALADLDAAQVETELLNWNVEFRDLMEFPKPRVGQYNIAVATGEGLPQIEVFTGALRGGHLIAQLPLGGSRVQEKHLLKDHGFLSSRCVPYDAAVVDRWNEALNLINDTVTGMVGALVSSRADEETLSALDQVRRLSCEGLGVKVPARPERTR